MRETLIKMCHIVLEMLGEVVADEYQPTVDILSPLHRIPISDIKYNKGKLVISGLKDLWVTTVLDSNSMDPLIDSGHTCVLTKDFLPEELTVGDICVYWNGKRDVIHRISKIGLDEKGRRYTFQGDNCSKPDPYIVRDEHLRWLLMGVMY